jgi:uncharacterized protein DUF3971
MSSADPAQSPRPPRRISVWRRFGIGSLLMSLLTAAVLGVVVYMLMGRPVSAPPWLREQVQARAAEALETAHLRFGAFDLVVTEGAIPQLRMTNVQLVTDTGTEIVSFGELRAGLSLTDLIRGQLRPSSIAISGVFANLQRQADGSVALSGGLDLTSPTQRAATFAELIEGIDDLLLRPALAALTEADIRALTLRIEDQRSGRAWTIDGGRMRLTRANDEVRITSDLALLSGGQGVATLAANYESRIGEHAAAFGLNIADIDSGDIATLAPPFAWLDVLRAPISGALRGGIAADGRLAPLNVSLTIGAGVVQPTDATRPVPFNSARSYFNFDPAEGVLAFDELSVESDWITARLDGQTVLSLGENGQLDDLVGQFSARTLSANPDDLYPEPVSFDAAEMDFRLTLNPFRLTVGQALFRDQGQVLLTRGTLEADTKGWRYGLDGQMDGLSPERLLAFWPERFVPKTRQWLLDNLIGGSLRNIDVVLRDGPETPTTAFVGFEFEDAHVRYVKTLPTLTGGRGSASLLDNRFVVSVDAGQVVAPQGGIVEVGGSSFIIPDVTVRDGTPAEVRLEARGTVTAALSLLDQPPLSVIEKAGLSPTLADGSLQVAGTLALPLKPGLQPSEVIYNASGTARNVVSTELIKERRLAAGTLRVQASNEQVKVSGLGTLDGVPFDAAWTQALGETPQPGTVAGTIEVSERTIDAFQIGLPAGLVRGKGVGNITVGLPLGGAVPTFTLDSNLRGLRLSSPPLGWTKPESAAGLLSLSGTLGDTPRVDRLSLGAPGLSAEGSVTLTPGGGLELARFTQVRVGEWLNAPVDLVGRGRGRASGVVVRGGTLDLRKADFGGASSGTGGQQGGGPLTLALDRLHVTNAITLTDMTGEFDMARGLDGAFRARVNGATAIEGRVLPQGGRSAIQITSQDAGGVAGSAGILKQARGGDLSLTLLPVGAASFDGTLKITETRIQDAPAIAALLNALSIVGLLEQMGGSGIHFQEVDAAFRLTPSTMALTRASAVGPSMGLSMDGTYDVTRSILDMQGVISPLFIINGIGSIFTRKGEGLIGFNYRLRGPAANPRVQVNPLSALTPGLFREIFRAPAPELPRVEGDTAPASRPEAFAPEEPKESNTERIRRQRQQALEER